MRNNNKDIFESDNRKRKKLKIKGINNLAHNSGYMHDWSEEKKARRNRILKYAAVYGGLLAVTIGITIFVNMQDLNQAKRDREEFLANITPAPTQAVESASPEPVIYSREFDMALVMYPDTVGYLIIPGTDIDFPVVQGEDNYFFENRNYDRSYSNVAATYMLTECDPGSSRHIIIYGENVEIEDRFSQLESYLDYDFFAANEFITLELKDGAKTWQVFSVHLANINFDYKDIEFETNTEYLAYIKMFETMSRFDRGITLDEQDQIVTLVTDYHDLDLKEGFLIVHARRIN
jgi:sortase B